MSKFTKINKCNTFVISKSNNIINKKINFINEYIINFNKKIDIINKQINKITLVDLFSGTGAFSYAFHKTNMVKTIYANDILDSSEEIFNLNNKIKLTKKDLNEIDRKLFLEKLIKESRELEDEISKLVEEKC